MASVFTHAAIPLIAGRRLGLGKRELLVGAALGCAADLDMLGYAFDVHTQDPLGHRGLTHSLLLALAAGASVAWLLRRAAPARTGLAFFCFCALSHGLIDALTFGDHGVALLAPLSWHRWLIPLHLVSVFPVGANEALGLPGLMVLFAEALFFVAPVGWVAWASRGGSRPALAVTGLLWLAAFGFLRHALPQVFGPPLERQVLESTQADRGLIPTDGLPDGGLVTRLDDLKAAGLVGRRLVPREQPWSSEFFPFWFGGHAGRWRDSNLTLIGRTLAGFQPPSAAQAQEQERKSDSGDAAARAWLYGLSPTEKYDLARDDYAFSSSHAELGNTHNARPRPRFWFGMCDGVSAAALAQPEPWREVTVVSPSGHQIPFHPNDLKALLSVSYECTAQKVKLGGLCAAGGIDSGRLCSMNPADLVLTTLNRLGLAKSSFLVDVYPSLQTQFFPVTAAQIDLGAEHPAVDAPMDAGFAPKVAKLIDFDARFELSSTTLPASAADVKLDGAPGRYQKVGVRPVHYEWTGTLALGADSQILGGRWTGDPANGPDAVMFVGGGPCVTDGGTVDDLPTLSLAPIQRLAALSESDAPGELSVTSGELFEPEPGNDGGS